MGAVGGFFELSSLTSSKIQTVYVFTWAGSIAVRAAMRGKGVGSGGEASALAD
jgi:hypothetical protein